MSVSAIEIMRLLVLLGLIGMCAWSVFDSGNPNGGAKSKHASDYVGRVVRQLEPDFTICGEGSVRTESYKDEKRSLCSATVREATIIAQSKCSAYIENEADCRLERESICDTQTGNVQGCARLVVAAALAKQGIAARG